MSAQPQSVKNSTGVGQIGGNIGYGLKMLTINSGRRSREISQMNSPHEVITQDVNTISQRNQAGAFCGSAQLSNSVMNLSVVDNRDSVRSGIQIENQDPLRVTPF